MEFKILSIVILAVLSIGVYGEGVSSEATYQLGSPTQGDLKEHVFSFADDHCKSNTCYNETELYELDDAAAEMHNATHQHHKRAKGPKGWTSGGRMRGDVLKYHNLYRQYHGVPPLKWSPQMARFALRSARSCVFAHSQPYTYGENLAGGTMDNPAFMTYLWYDEIRLYNFNKPGFSHETGHFTQLLWKGSTAIGCAFVAGCPGGLPQMLFCEYTPNGNISPAWVYTRNVPRPKNGAKYPKPPPEYLSRKG